MGEASRRILEELKRANLTAAASAASPAQQDAAMGVAIASLVSIGAGEPGSLAAFFEAMASPDGEVAGRVQALGVAIGCLSDDARNTRLGLTPESLAAAQTGAVRVAEAAVAFCGRAALGVLQKGFGEFDRLLAPAGAWPPMQLSPLEPLRREFQSFLTRLEALLSELEQ